jgi:cytochrome c-type biogenesis protein CcmH
MRARLLGALMAATAAATLGLPSPATAAPSPRASFTDVENDVMCVSCREPLAVAQSPQAYAERAYIRSLIAQGLTKPQIERELVAQYGPAVLGRPPAHGFNLAVYIVPPGVLLAGVITLVLVLPRWRRRSRTRSSGPAPAIDPLEAQRLEADLSQWRG